MFLNASFKIIVGDIAKMNFRKAFFNQMRHQLSHIRKLGKRSGAVLNPSTPEDTLRYVLDEADQILVMSVNPGFGGQSFIEQVLPKLTALKAMIDGGIGPDTIARAVAAGARIFVAGNAVFTQKPYDKAIAELRRLGNAALHREA